MLKFVYPDTRPRRGVILRWASVGFQKKIDGSRLYAIYELDPSKSERDSRVIAMGLSRGQAMRLTEAHNKSGA